MILEFFWESSQKLGSVQYLLAEKRYIRPYDTFHGRKVQEEEMIRLTDLRRVLTEYGAMKMTHEEVNKNI